MMAPSIPLPDIADNSALFLDVDGTLLEIASTPDAVEVSVVLRSTLRLICERQQGALALISGRTIAALDALFAPCRFAVAGQHGFERRDPNGHYMAPDVDDAELRYIRQTLTRLAMRYPALLIEDKGASLAVHYRAAPELGEPVRKSFHEMLSMLAGRYRLREGKFVFEFVPAGAHSKRTAVEAFMQEAPFAGRVPLFVGDDITDEDGFAAVNAMGGHSIKVGSPQGSCAHYAITDVGAVLTWLQYHASRRPG